MRSSLPPEQLARILAQTDADAAEGPRRGAPVLLGDQRVTLAAVDLTWAETFFLCLKFAICAVPALWIAWAAWHLPALIFGAGAAAAVLSK